MWRKVGRADLRTLDEVVGSSLAAQLSYRDKLGTTVTEDRLRQRGYIPFLEYYLKAKFGDDYRGYGQRK